MLKPKIRSGMNFMKWEDFKMTITEYKELIKQNKLHIGEEVPEEDNNTEDETNNYQGA